MITHKKITFFATITSFRRLLRKRFHVSGNVCHNFLLFYSYYLFSFSSGCDRYVENDDECCIITFLDLITNFMENVADFLQFRLAVSDIGN